MRKLFLVRHGSYGSILNPDRGLGLNDCGKEQMKRTGGKMKRILANDSVYIMTSTAQRAVESANILASEICFKGNLETSTYLWSGDDAPDEGRFDYKNERLMQIIEEKWRAFNSLIVVSHFEVCHELSRYIIWKKGISGNYPERIDRGEALYFDLENKIYKILSLSESF